MKILAIKFKFLGDVAITVTALRALHQAYPNAELHFLVSEEALPIVQHIPWINKVWGYPRKKGQGNKKKALSIIRKLRKEKFNLSVDFVGNDRGAWISLLIAAKTRLGPIAPKGFWGRKYCYTHRVPEASNNMHETERELHLLSNIAIPRPNSTEPELYSDPKLIDYPEHVLPHGAILCHISASATSKEWPVSKWAELYIQSPEFQSRFVFTSGASPREIELLENLHSQIPNARIIKWVKFSEQSLDLKNSLIFTDNINQEEKQQAIKLYRNIIKQRAISTIPSIAEPMALINAADAVICGDTFASHAAAGLGTPVVVLFGPTLPKQWAPKGNSIVVETDWCNCRHFFYKCTNNVHCLSMLPASKVHKALTQLLERTHVIENATH